ncbi:MAG: NAD-binding protein [Phycisphaerales bacterium]
MAWSEIESVVLVLWVLALLGLVGGVFTGVLCPGRARADAAHTDETRRRRWACLFGTSGRWGRTVAAALARWRVWVIVGVLLSGLVLGTISAYCTAEVVAAAGEVDGAAYGQGVSGRFLDMLYAGVREVTGEAEPRAEHPLVSRMARAAGLAAVLLLAFELIVKLFHEPVQRWRLRRQRGHVVICGLGRIGRELCRACCKAGLRVTVVESDPDNPGITAATDQGALVWIGDATRKSVLRLVRAGRASHVFFVIGTDERNLEAAYDLLSVLLEPGSGGAGSGRDLAEATPPEMVVHLDRPALGTVLLHMKQEERLRLCAAELKSRCAKPEHRAAIDGALAWLSKTDITLRSFNATDRAIQQLFDTHILDRRPVLAEAEKRVEMDGPSFEVAHFVIIGFGQVGQRLALHLAEQAHFENLRRSRLTIVYAPHEAEVVTQFRDEHPALFPTSEIVAESDLGDYDPASPDHAWMPDPRLDQWSLGVRVREFNRPTDEDRGVRFVCNGGFVEHAGGVTSPVLIERLARLSHEPTVRPMVFLCDAEDEDNCAHALQLRQELDLRLKRSTRERHRRDHAITIFPFVPNRPMLTQLTTPEDANSADLIPFGDCAAACTFENLKADPVLPVATAIFADYIENRPPQIGVASSTWESCSAWERHANISPALHLNAKLRVLGLRLVPAGSASRLSVTNLPRHEEIASETATILAQMEHHRWMAERLIRGWSYGERATPENKRRHQFVPWEMIQDPNERDKDYTQLVAVLRVCERLIHGQDARFVAVRS